MALCLGPSRELITLPPQAGLDMRLRLEHQQCRRCGPRIVAFLVRRPAADSRCRSRSRDAAGARGLSRPCAAAAARKPAPAGTDPANAHPISPTPCSVCPVPTTDGRPLSLPGRRPRTSTSSLLARRKGCLLERVAAQGDLGQVLIHDGQYSNCINILYDIGRRPELRRQRSRATQPASLL